MRVLLLGGTGFIGSRLASGLRAAGHTVLDPRIDVRDFIYTWKAIVEAAPDYIVNATGITGKPNVDYCEEHIAETYVVNISGALNVAIVAYELGVKVAQVSSGCIYDGDNGGDGWRETDAPNFFGSVYSRSRIICEAALEEFDNVLQLRIRIPILSAVHPKNLIDKLAAYPTMINRVNSCTVLEDFVPAAIALIEMGAVGIFNMTNIGAMNHEAIMLAYKEIVDTKFELRFMSQADEIKLCARRSNCVLSSAKRETVGAHMPPLEESLRRILSIRNADSTATPISG